MKKALSIALIALVVLSSVFAQGATEKDTSGPSGELILYTTVKDAHYVI